MFRIYEPPNEEPAFITKPVLPAPKLIRKKHPRCVCGCGKAAFWPHDGSPVFHTRLCGYQMALAMFSDREKAE